MHVLHRRLNLSAAEPQGVEVLPGQSLKLHPSLAPALEVHWEHCSTSRQSPRDHTQSYAMRPGAWPGTELALLHF